MTLTRERDRGDASEARWGRTALGKVSTGLMGSRARVLHVFRVEGTL